MSTAQIAQAPFLQQMPAPMNSGTPQASGNKKNGNGQQQNSADNISLSNGTIIGGTIGITTAALAIGAGGTYLALRDKPPKTETSQQPFNNQARQSARNISHEAMTYHRIDANGLKTPIPTLPTDLGNDSDYPSPISKTPGARFHPRESGSNCAVDTLNMLVNGYKPLRIAPVDYQLMMKGWDLNGKKQDIVAKETAIVHKGIVNTITDPKDFPRMYEQNLQFAKLHLDNPRNEDLKNNPHLKKQWKDELARIEAKAGQLHPHELKVSSKDIASEDIRQALEKALKGFDGKAIAIAKPLKKEVLGAAQKELQFEHHYFTLENAGSTWIKRDSIHSKIIPLHYKGQPVKTPHEAVLSELEFEAKRANSTDPKIISTMDFEKPMHVFIPGKA